MLDKILNTYYINVNKEPILVTHTQIQSHIGTFIHRSYNCIAAMTSIQSDEESYLSIKEPTREKYKKTWTDFKKWSSISDKLETRPLTEDEILRYICFLREEKGTYYI